MNPFDFSRTSANFAVEASNGSEVVGDRTTAARRQFQDAIRKAGWTQLFGGSDLVPKPTGREVVIGAAPWSATDIAALGEFLERTADQPTPVFVFDIDSCRTVAEVERLMPGAPPPHKTPAVAEYLDGTLVRALRGKDAIDWLGGVERANLR